MPCHPQTCATPPPATGAAIGARLFIALNIAMSFASFSPEYKSAAIERDRTMPPAPPIP